VHKQSFVAMTSYNATSSRKCRLAQYMTNARIDNKGPMPIKCHQSRQFLTRFLGISYLCATEVGKSLLKRCDLAIEVNRTGGAPSRTQ
jgi:hypothetical protein